MKLGELRIRNSNLFIDYFEKTLNLVFISRKGLDIVFNSSRDYEKTSISFTRTNSSLL